MTRRQDEHPSPDTSKSRHRTPVEIVRNPPRMSELGRDVTALPGRFWAKGRSAVGETVVDTPDRSRIQRLA
jgi:hypothetical protein